jgi:hypothetical protein
MALPAAPFIAPASGTIDQRLAQVATAINKKADAATEPAYSAVLLIAPDRSVWRLSVDPTGALSTAQVTR